MVTVMQFSVGTADGGGRLAAFPSQAVALVQ